MFHFLVHPFVSPVTGTAMSKVQNPPQPAGLIANKVHTLHVDDLTSVPAVEGALEKTLEAANSVELSLEGLLSRAAAASSARAVALTNVTRQATMLSDDAAELAVILDSSAKSAQTLSARVRFLDRVLLSGTSALTRVDHVLTLRVCAEGAKTCLSAGDLPTAASHVQMYLKLDPDVREDPSSLAAVAQINQSIDELKRKVRQKADQAAKAIKDLPLSDSDSQSSSSFQSLLSTIKLFVPIGLSEEGISRFSSCLVAQIAAEADRDVRSLLMDGSVSATGSAESTQQPHSVALAQLFETIASYVHDSETQIVESFGWQSFVTLTANVQEQCDVQSDKILLRYVEARRLEEVDRAVKTETANPRDLDPLLNELSILSQRTASYFEFLKARCTQAAEKSKNASDIDDSYDADNESHLTVLHEALNACKLSKWASNLQGRYVSLEAYFMRENVRKAIRIDEHTGDISSKTSTAVDDVFFVLQKVVNRALSYGNSLDALLAVLPHVNRCIGADLSGHVRRRLRETEEAMGSMLDQSSVSSSLPSAALTVSYLAEFAKANISSASVSGAESVPSEAGPSYDFFVALNNASVSADYALRFRANVEHLAVQQYGASLLGGRAALGSLLGKLEESSRTLSILCQDGLDRIATVLTSHIRSHAEELLNSVSFVVLDSDYNTADSTDRSFSQELLDEVEGKVLHPSVEERLTDSNWDTLVRHVADWAASMVETHIFLPRHSSSANGKSFNALGGLRADRDVRSMSAYFAGKCRGSSVRDVFARLSQFAMLVNLENPVEIYDLWGSNAGGMTWRLAPAEVRIIMGLRVDWSASSIEDLKL